MSEITVAQDTVTVPANISIDVAAAAAHLNVGPQTVRRLIDKGYFPSCAPKGPDDLKVRRNVRLLLSEVIAAKVRYDRELVDRERRPSSHRLTRDESQTVERLSGDAVLLLKQIVHHVRRIDEHLLAQPAVPTSSGSTSQPRLMIPPPPGKGNGRPGL